MVNGQAGKGDKYRPMDKFAEGYDKINWSDDKMTLPNERYRSLTSAKVFLRELLDPKETPRVPKAIRMRAYAVLRHFPFDSELEQLQEKLPKLFGKE
tara:strand:- start:4438 stop:4728 length:291 start_codon:yes stop_codon:yes gene_type:complete